MKNLYTIVSYTIIALLATHTAQATKQHIPKFIVVYNKSDYTLEVCPFWSARGEHPARLKYYYKIEPGELHGGSDSESRPLESITWRQRIQSGKDSTCYKKYSKAIDPKIATMNNTFEIFNDGSYRITQENRITREDVLIEEGVKTLQELSSFDNINQENSIKSNYLETLLY